MAQSLLQSPPSASSSSSSSSTMSFASSLFPRAFALQSLSFDHSRTPIFAPIATVVIIFIYTLWSIFFRFKFFFFLIFKLAFLFFFLQFPFVSSPYEWVCCARNVIWSNHQTVSMANRSFPFSMNARFPSSSNQRGWRKRSTGTVTSWSYSLAAPILHFPR